MVQLEPYHNNTGGDFYPWRFLYSEIQCLILFDDGAGRLVAVTRRDSLRRLLTLARRALPCPAPHPYPVVYKAVRSK